MFNGKMKAVTFSYDDGVTQDKRLIKILDKYGLKATFNLNSELLGTANLIINKDGVTVPHCKPTAKEAAEIYKNHEIAVHTLTHPLLPSLSEKKIIRQVEDDRENLEDIAGYNIVGMAYPCGGKNSDERVAEIIKNNTEILYARTIVSSYSFEPQENLHLFNPTVRHNDWEKLFELGEKFVKMQPDSPKIFYIWGHSYEFDFDDSWDRFEDFCKLIHGKDDIFYGTNTQVLLGHNNK